MYSPDSGESTEQSTNVFSQGDRQEICVSNSELSLPCFNRFLGKILKQNNFKELKLNILSLLALPELPFCNED